MLCVTKPRNHTDIIILTIIPHLFSLYFSYNNILYSFLIFSATFSSYIWHLNREKQCIYMYIDYLFAGLLSTYEVYNTYNTEWFNYCILLNMSVLGLNKTVYFLSKYRYIRYNIFHSIFHIYSAFKTCFISYLSF